MITSGVALSAHFGDGQLRPADAAREHRRCSDQRPDRRSGRVDEYLREVVPVSGTAGPEFYTACRDVSRRQRCRLRGRRTCDHPIG